VLGSDYSLKSAISLANSTAMAKAYAIILDNPQLAGWTSAIQSGRNPPNIRDYGGLVMSFDTQNDDSRVLVRRVRLDIEQSPDPG